MAFPEDVVARARTAGRAAAELLRLPFGNHAWRGRTGHWTGSGKGSSLDFQDHRPYAPGDDLRHVNWQAYARTGNYSMKLYREEVTPAVDLVVDVSSSMFGALGLRPGSLRVAVTDALFPGAPEDVLRPLVARNGRGVILAPSSSAETHPDWRGNVDLIDCETGDRRPQRADGALLSSYAAAYRRHFDLWQAAAVRHGAEFAQVPSNGSLSAALQGDGVARGAVEWAR
jgi:Protein of unknown function DUF58